MQGHTYNSFFLLWFIFILLDNLELTALALSHAPIPRIPVGIFDASPQHDFQTLFSVSH